MDSDNWRRLRLTERADGVTISTIKFGCRNNYETAIDLYGSWIRVEGYTTEKAAKEGHKKYENMSREEIKQIIEVKDHICEGEPPF